MRRVLSWPELVPSVLLVFAFVAGIFLSPYFLDYRYLLQNTTLYAETGLMVVGMTLVIVAGEIDLSVASALALVACLCGKLSAGASVPVVVIAGLVMGALLGAFNGVLVAYAKLPSFLVTLGTLAFFRGIAQALVGSEGVHLPSRLVGVDTLYLPYPVPMTLVLVVVVALAFGAVLHRTIYGRWLYATGSNESAAKFSAIPTERMKFSVFVISGLLAGLGGVLMDSRLGVARYDHAKGFELDVITATVLGGASIYGGKGSMLGAILAFFLIYFVKTGLMLANVLPEYQLAAVGTLLIVAVGANILTRRG